MLYHYTDAIALQGIYYEKQLWVSLTSKSKNDTLDTIYIKQIVQELMQEIRNHDNLYITKAFEVINSVLNPRGVESTKDYLINNVFMFCVNEIDNDDNMKSEFGTKKIIFNKERLINHFEILKEQNKFIEYKYGQVIYDKQTQKKLILNLLLEVEVKYIEFLEKGINQDLFTAIIAATPVNDFSGNHFIQYRKDNRWMQRFDFTIYEIEQQSRMWTYLANNFYKIAPFIKHPKFEDEREFRFSFYTKKDKVNELLHDRFIALDLSEDCLCGFIELDS